MNLEIEELSENHLENGFFETLENLKSENLNKNLKKAKNLLKNIQDDQNIMILVAVNDNKVIGSIKLIFEKKFYMNFAKVVHIEDVVTRKGYENQGIGRTLVNKAIKISKSKNCIKALLNCKDKRVNFYKKCGFNKKSNSMKLNL